MMLRPLAFIAFLTFGAIAAAALPAVAQDAAPAATISTDELMKATALDEIFTQFGPSIAASPNEQGVPFTADMRAAWDDAAREVFDARRMHDALAAALEDKFTAEDYVNFAAFFRSDFGVKVSAIERAVTVLPPASQVSAREEGIALASAEEGTRRDEQVEEMLVLVSADITKAMIRQSMRGMLVGMWMSNQQGDIAVPWEDLDAHLATIMPAIEADVALTQRAMMFYAYRELSEADLDAYLTFLRTDSARKFYAVAGYLVGEIIAERMEVFGETVSRNLARVSV